MDKQMQRNFYHRFLREAQAASELDHPNILSIYAYGEHHGLPYIVMPYMTGGTLSEYVAKYGPLSLREAQKYLEQISSALDYAHENGRVHCDVKPANILLDGWGHIVLSDFGIVRLMQSDAEDQEQSMKSSETLMGTPDYISPEQALGEPLDGRSDVYSLAVTLFFLLAGSPPFKAESSIALALMHVHEIPPALGTLRADITPEIDRVIGKALSKWPEERYQRAGEFSAAFAEAVTNADSSVFSESSAKRKVNSSHSGGKQAIAALNPVVQIKLLWKEPFKQRQVVLPLVLLVAVIIGSVVTFSIFKSHKNVPSYIQATATPSTKLIDDLADKQSEWPTSSIYFFDEKGQYHIHHPSTDGITMAFYGGDVFSNFRLTITTSEVNGLQDGGDYYGIIIRSKTDQSRYYLFEIAATKYRNQYGFWRSDGHGQTPHPLKLGYVISLNSKLGQSNTITVVAQGNTFNFYINREHLGNTVTDTSKLALTYGEIGLSVEEKNTEVVFSKLQIKTL